MIEYLNANSGSLSVFFSFIVALSTVCYAILTWRLVTETKRLREVQTEPKVSIRMESEEYSIGFIALFIKNEGQGPAYDVKFSYQFLEKESSSKNIIDDFEKLKFLKRGFDYLSPGQEVKSFFTSTYQAGDNLFKTKIEVDISYKNIHSKAILDKYLLDFSSFENRIQAGKPYLYEISNSLENIDKNLKKLISKLGG